MKHLGNVIKIDGAKIEPVDVITFGSPCQDLSEIGKRKGLKGERSALFYEATRIIREMRKATNGTLPRFAIWENVLGCLTSSGGDDFAAVLNEFLALNEELPVVRPNKLRKAGAICGDAFSLAWRTFNARYWGVPQSRNRVFACVDFRGQSAPAVLFKRQDGVVHLETMREGKGTAGNDNQDIARGGELWCLSRSHFFKAFTSQYCYAFTSSYSGTPHVIVSKSGARFMTATEYARCQGFPDDWGKIKPIPTREFDFWRGVWDEWDLARGKRFKSDAQIAKWMAEPYRESHEYHMWGNGVALPCVQYILNNVSTVLQGETK